MGPLDKIFSQEEIIRTINKSKTNKSSSGPIVNEKLKANPTSISHVLIQLFSYILEPQKFLKTWNLSLIKPVHKSGLQTKGTNYRGLCIPDHLSKIFTSILNERLESFVKLKHILPHQSLGFKKGFRTEDAMFILSTILDIYAKRGSKVYACFVDFANFYDTISHDHLFYKLLISGNFYFTLKDMYKNCRYAVKVNLPLISNTSKPKSKQITIRTCRTKIFSNGMGLRQGCNLSPLLANIYLAHLHDLLSKNNYNPPILTNNSITSIS